ncbi:DUF4148 domain-containing protein [Paraburkholderia acidisoli]|uniref:DUF4148 domain-containing protein n=1 Tax=Paraburkholderia acidisoli TaxID=2571748 RepID=A0A7Z2GGE8_9BURK|nr:DUF4148 domain-containing protein [Paraburkholderia acidisoli]QGZ60989.1 DUF4148 domain-containing protein [Paraburkholderia acidisoli]
MKSLIQTVAAAAALAALVAPAAAFAQSSTITRAQVRAELVQLQQAGYRVGEGDNAHYPEAIQAAEAKVAAMNGANTGYGGAANASQSGGRGSVSSADWNTMYSR